MALEGNLKDFSLKDMLRLLESGSKTGVLHVTRTEGEGVLCLLNGLVLHASAGPFEPVASRLVGTGIITSKQLRQAQGLMRIQKKEKAGRRLGQVLVDEGYVDAAVLEDFVTGQIADALFELLQWAEGEIRFVAGDSCPESDMGIAVPLDAALSRADMRLQTWQQILEEIPIVDARFVMASGPAELENEIHLKPLEWTLLCYIHGGRSVHELAELAGLSDYDAALAVYGMQAGGLIEKVETAAEPVKT